MEAAIAARIRFNASTATDNHIFSRACPEIGANISPHAGAKIGASLSSSIGVKTFSVFPRVDAEIFSSPRGQERQIGQPDYSGRRRASE
jgi:hypothetical protein